VSLVVGIATAQCNVHFVVVFGGDVNPREVKDSHSDNHVDQCRS